MYEEEKKKYQQRWEFRDVRDRFNDSSSEDDDCISIKKKHKLLSDMLFPETDEETGVNSPLSKSRMCQKWKKGKRVVIPSHSPKKKKMKKETMKKKKENISLDGLKKFMESMLGELRVERESMFSRMRKEMKRMDSNQKVTPKKVTTTISSASLINKEEVDHMNMMMHQKLEEEEPQTNNGQSAFDSNGKMERWVKNPLLHSMMKKTVQLPEAAAGGGGTGTGSDMTVGSEIVDMLTSPILSAGFLSGGGEQLGSLCKMVSTNTSNVNGFSLYGNHDHHHQLSNVGRRGDGFAVPLHMGIMGNGNGADKINNNNNNAFGLRIGGGALRFSGGGGGGNHNIGCSTQPDDNDNGIW